MLDSLLYFSFKNPKYLIYLSVLVIFNFNRYQDYSILLYTILLTLGFALNMW